MTDTRQAPAAWYPDPENTGLLRWWDGYQWGPVAAAPTAPPRTAAPATIVGFCLSTAAIGLFFITGYPGIFLGLAGLVTGATGLALSKHRTNIILGVGAIILGVGAVALGVPVAAAFNEAVQNAQLIVR